MTSLSGLPSSMYNWVITGRCWSQSAWEAHLPRDPRPAMAGQICHRTSNTKWWMCRRMGWMRHSSMVMVRGTGMLQKDPKRGPNFPVAEPLVVSLTRGEPSYQSGENSGFGWKCPIHHTYSRGKITCHQGNWSELITMAKKRISGVRRARGHGRLEVSTDLRCRYTFSPTLWFFCDEMSHGTW